MSFNEMDFKDYSGLNKVNEYDKTKAELLAEAVTEKLALEKRVKYLDQLIDENQDLTPFLWTTLQGECKALHKITDSHLKNILKHIVNRGGNISKEIRAEALSRNLPIPTDAEIYEGRMNRLIEAELVDRNDMELL